MAQHQETDGVKIHFSSEDGYLIVEYLTTGTDHTSKQCRDWHAANMKKREYECVDSEGRYLLKIECDFPFHAGDGESGIIATETREDAIQLGRFFFQLNPTIGENSESPLWPWKIDFQEVYAYQEWKKAMSSKSTARISKDKRSRSVKSRRRRKA